MVAEQVWVLAFDPVSDERVRFVCCPEGAAAAHASVFEMEGYTVRVCAQEEIDALIEEEQAR